MVQGSVLTLLLTGRRQLRMLSPLLSPSMKALPTDLWLKDPMRHQICNSHQLRLPSLSLCRCLQRISRNKNDFRYIANKYVRCCCMLCICCSVFSRPYKQTLPIYIGGDTSMCQNPAVDQAQHCLLQRSAAHETCCRSL